MAAEEHHTAPLAQPSTVPNTEIYRYSASSYTTKTNEGIASTCVCVCACTLCIICTFLIEELFELVQLSGVPMDKELFKVVSWQPMYTLHMDA